MLKTSFCKDFLMNASLMSQLSLQSPQKAGLYVYVNVIFFESEILGILLCGLERFITKSLQDRKRLLTERDAVIFVDATLCNIQEQCKYILKHYTL